MNKNQPKHIYAEKKIRDAIRQCKAGEKIPGERVFAKELGISYMTARKAVESLVQKGVLYKIPKKGTYVADRKTAARKMRNIGYFLDASIKQGLSSPYYSLIFDAIEKEATANDYALIYFSDISDSSSLDIVKKLDGVIISCFPRIDDLILEMNKQVPVVCIDNKASDKTIPSITIDNQRAVYEAVNYLCSLGHERIGFITGLDDSDVGRHRLEGYLSALRSNGISESTDLVYKGDYSFGTGANGASYFLSLDAPPTAIMCANDTMAIGAIKEIRQRGLTVPGDISIMGFDDITVASHMAPALTTVAAPVKEIAQHSVRMLSDLISGTAPGELHMTLSARQVLRNTCAERNNRPIASKEVEAS